MDLRCNIDNLPLFEPNSVIKTRAINIVNLYGYLKFCDGIMWTAGPNNSFWLTEATGMDANSCDMLNGANFALFLNNRGCYGSTWGKTKNWRCCSYGNVGNKNDRFHLNTYQ